MIIDCSLYLRIFCSLLISLSPLLTLGQQAFEGLVVDANKNPLSYVSVSVVAHDSMSTLTDSAGYFSITGLPSATEVEVLFSLLGYQSKQAILRMGSKESHMLLGESQTLQTVEVWRSVKDLTSINLGKLDIYTNPIAGADALNALQIYAYSSNVDETANPSFRGSEADRSRVFINSVPINSPVRNSQINGVGNFSIFNTELIQSIDVFPGNPPLIYGNTGAGLIDIKTSESVKNSTQLSLSIASVGALINRNLSKDAFTQIYANHQFDGPLLKLNSKGLGFLKSFRTTDVGWNSNWKVSEADRLNFYAYYIDEYAELTSTINFSNGLNQSGKRRGFFIMNYQKSLSDKLNLALNSSYDMGKSRIDFLQIDVASTSSTLFNSLLLNYQKEGLNITTGLEYNLQQSSMQGVGPRFYYSNHDSSQTQSVQGDFGQHILESFLHGTYSSNRLTYSLGLRKNVPLQHDANGIKGSDSYFSFQSYIKWKISAIQNLIFSAGRYHNYTEPNVMYQRQALNQTDQLAVDYVLKRKSTSFNASLYAKREQGMSNTSYEFLESMASQREIIGLELSVQQNFWKYFRLLSSFSLMDASFDIEGTRYNTSNNIPYFFKNALTFSKNRFNISLTALNRPGTRYTRVVDGNYIPEARAYEPIYEQQLNGSQLGAYHRLDLNISKLIPIKNNLLTLYFNVNNLLGAKNQRNLIYTPDFSGSSFEHFNGNVIFLGANITLY
ncbi:TonB-dependent receptor [Sphingobacterium bambusae]|uniref:Carboxypeptidase-like regulatory domain-containing protein n=1 Tax=Sphingobacterium bambusae TaxID=662858 RepID=A0ABW6BNM4_9SPHI|nr:TonB-dependent receptor [Sphingobacterium bambusae]WPL51011.1 TonB-dependent receptor [Sphingobacterium bambusae]